MLSVTIGIPTLKTRKEVQKQINEINTFPPSCKYEVIASCIKQSAAKNRNWIIDNAKYDIVIELDDDITSFFPGWADILVDALFFNDFLVVSGRPFKSDGTLAATLGDCNNKDISQEFQKCIHTQDTGLNVCCSSCIAFWKKDAVRFDENYRHVASCSRSFCLWL